MPNSGYMLYEHISSLSVQNLVCANNRILQERRKTLYLSCFCDFFVDFLICAFKGTSMKGNVVRFTLSYIK